MMGLESLMIILYIGIFIISLLLLFKTIKKLENKTTTLVRCLDCNTKVSINASHCPKCGSESYKNKTNNIDASLESSYNKLKILLIIYELILGISIVFVFEKADEFLPELLILLSLILNTISLIIFNIKNNNIRKELNKSISFISICAIICGLFFSINYTIQIFTHLNNTYDSDLREILYLGNYDKIEAKELLYNIYKALNREDRNDLELYGIWKDENDEDTYYINLRDTNYGSYLSPNAIKVEVEDKTKVKRIYWQFDDTVELTFYEYGEQVEEFEYLYVVSSVLTDTINPIKDEFEEKVKNNLKAPSSAIFTYTGIKYDTYDNRFYHYGYVESQNSFGAMIKTEFEIELRPYTGDEYRYYPIDYTWEFI